VNVYVSFSFCDDRAFSPLSLPPSIAPPLTQPRLSPFLNKQNSPAWFAIVGATVLCISSDRIDVEELMHLVEWDMLIFFAALFCMVEGAIEVGLIDMIGGFLAGIIRAAPPEARRIVAIQILLWLSTIISGE
jgi:Na+/H+ antiporter NhaD/arsenite permease-like protein